MNPQLLAALLLGRGNPSAMPGAGSRPPMMQAFGQMPIGAGLPGVDDPTGGGPSGVANGPANGPVKGGPEEWQGIAHQMRQYMKDWNKQGASWAPSGTAPPVTYGS